jgi:hypothetical protein
MQAWRGAQSSSGSRLWAIAVSDAQAEALLTDQAPHGYGCLPRVPRLLSSKQLSHRSKGRVRLLYNTHLALSTRVVVRGSVGF